MTYRNVIDALYQGRTAQSALFIQPDGAIITTADAHVRIAMFSAALRKCGVQVGDRVTLKVAKSVDGILIAHAILHAGAILHPLNEAYTDAEIGSLLADAQPALVICDPAEADRFAPLVQGAMVHTVAAGAGSLLDLCDPALAPVAASVPAQHDGAALLYTSGTTGKPKGALITHGNLIGNAQSLAKIWQLGPDDVLLHALPIYHAHGLLTSINVMLASGGALRMLEKFEAPAVLAALSRTTLMMGVPTHYARLLAEADLAKSIGDRFRFAISGSSALPIALAERFLDVTGVPLLERYGSTEAAIVVAVPPDATDRLGWVGWPLPDVSVRVRAEDGTAAAQGIGELETTGPHVFAGYWHNQAATQDALTADGWFRTGDIAQIDDTGCVRILGRSKDLVITGGLNVYPAEVENALTALPEIAAAAVFGVPHPDFGEAVVAAVELVVGATLDERAAIKTLRQTLAAYKTPKRILVQTIPRNAMSKIMKPTLRDTHAALFVPSQ
ncbi:malonyl-CoA/methylmalonyl-CoA synthetase [Monaibacterium marinum]|uniref:Malonyl-CoA/methylmalonyl-CoA synthetase n=1 Tax=Pontivivens marinum TaxID=1690039 RepID=A0A2C9CWY0_9RHOB|nr:AMP-binding protein [Monaibacterium marinum]SOH94949.1 malonyl-CoA/methylmalonyl-CoA synthetase [Monaibacterium marinum]